VVHHEYAIFHPYVAWREKQIPKVDSAQQFIMTRADEPLTLAEPVDAIICADVAEHVWDPKQMLRDIHATLNPGGYLIWNSYFGEGISCHLHPDLKGHEEELLADLGFERIGDLPSDYIGHSGLYRSVPIKTKSENKQQAPKTIDGILEENQWQSSQEIERIQWDMLQSLLKHTYEHVPFYRRLFETHGIDPRDIRTMDDFQKIPVLRKADIQQNLEAMRAENCPQDQLIKDATGGSTGQPLVFYRDLPAKEWLLAASRRFRRWMGYNSKSRLALIWGADRDFPTSERPNQRWLNAFNCSEKDIESFMAELVRWKPDAIRAYSSSIAMVASYMAENNIPAPRPHVIECAAEKLWPSQRRLIERVFGCPVYEMYGSRELPALACECESHNGMHIFSDVRLIETLDNGKPTAPGQEGSLVITDLVNYGMPLIRYEIGDVGVISDKQCPCGRGFPLLKEIKGRVSSTIQAPDGRRIHGEYFTHLFYNVPAVKAFQVRQKKIDEVVVLIQPDKNFKNAVMKPILKQMRQHLGSEVNIDWQCVDDIPLTPTGKRHFTISEISAEYLSDEPKHNTVKVQPPEAEESPDKKKILFIVDRPGWAHDFKTDNLTRQLGHLYAIKKVYCDQVQAEQIHTADLVLMYYWKQMRHENMKKLLSVFEENCHKLLIGICSHHELEGVGRKIAIFCSKSLVISLPFRCSIRLTESIRTSMFLLAPLPIPKR
ncbi:MAG: methyltransferase domain-containing protein, partial [Planctomycetota bacterium]